MHRPLLLMTTIILRVTTIAVTMVTVSIQPPSPGGASNSGNVATVLRYYDAVNAMIATGDPTALRDVVHPEVIDLHPPPPEFAGRVGFEDYLAYLHTVAPDIRIEAGTVAGNDERVVAQLAIRQGPSSFPLGFIGDETTSFWPPVETFRVSGGQIVERHVLWEGLFALGPVSGHPFTLDIPARRNLEVVFSTYEPLAWGRFATGVFPAIFRVVSGTVALSLHPSSSGAALVLNPSFNAEPETHEQAPPGKKRRLRQGEVIFVPPSAAFSIHNLWEVPASLLSVTVLAPSATGPDQNTLAQSWQHGITARSLLTLPTDSLAGTAQLSLGSATMMSGSRLTLNPATSLMLLWAESDMVATTARRSTCAEAGFAGSSLPDDAQRLTGLHLICPNGKREDVVFNAGTEPSTAWIIAITPKPG